MEEKKKGFFAEFREFISRGNVLDMAVGVIVATAFGKITTALVNNVIMPFIGWIFGGANLTDALDIMLTPAEIDPATGEVIKEANILGLGTFLNTVIDFLIIAFIVFCIIKAFNKAHDLAEAKLQARKKAAEEAAAEEPPAPTTEELLTAILDELRKENNKA